MSWTAGGSSRGRGPPGGATEVVLRSGLVNFHHYLTTQFKRGVQTAVDLPSH